KHCWRLPPPSAAAAERRDDQRLPDEFNPTSIASLVKCRSRGATAVWGPGLRLLCVLNLVWPFLHARGKESMIRRRTPYLWRKLMKQHHCVSMLLVLLVAPLLRAAEPNVAVKETPIAAPNGVTIKVRMQGPY